MESSVYKGLSYHGKESLSYEAWDEKKELTEFIQNCIWGQFVTEMGWTHPPKFKSWGELAEKLEAGAYKMNELERQSLIDWLRRGEKEMEDLAQAWVAQKKESDKLAGQENSEIDLGIYG